MNSNRLMLYGYQKTGLEVNPRSKKGQKLWKDKSTLVMWMGQAALKMETRVWISAWQHTLWRLEGNSLIPWEILNEVFHELRRWMVNSLKIIILFLSLHPPSLQGSFFKIFYCFIDKTFIFYCAKHSICKYVRIMEWPSFLRHNNLLCA